jgi:hypothetical protein
MGACERLVYFEAKYGKRVSRSQAKAINDGRLQHEKFFKAATRINPHLETSLNKPWCFIATVAFGPAAPETQLLRRFRDRVKRGTMIGRAAIKTYYRFFPRICKWLHGRPAAISAIRFLLKVVVKVAILVLRVDPRREKVKF